MTSTRPRWILAFLILVCAFSLASITSASARDFPAKTVWFGNETLGPNDEINGDLAIIFGNVVCDGGRVTGDVRVFWGSFDTPDCWIGGEQSEMLSPEWPSMMPALPWMTPSIPLLGVTHHNLLRSIAYSVLVILVFLLFPMRVRITLDRVERLPGLCAAVGTIAAIAVIPVAILLVISVVGIPLIVVEIAAIFAGIWIGQGAVSILIGRRLIELILPHTTPSPFIALLLGLLVIGAAGLVPYFGWAIMALIALVGLGATILGVINETAFNHPIIPPQTPPPTESTSVKPL